MGKWLVKLVIIYQANNISKSFGEHQVLKSVSLVLKERERVGLVGVNGSGKTTLLKCLVGIMESDTGDINKSDSLSIAYLEQLPQVANKATVWDAMMDSFADLLEKRRQLQELEQEMGQDSDRLEKVMENYARVLEDYERAGGYACEASARRILLGLGFREEEFNKPYIKLSGGEKTRLNLGRLLAMQADLVMLDEPTNHLDIPSVEWLEEWLKNYPGTILIVSHDRMFLDRVVSRVVELKDGRLNSFPGNYSSYLQQKALKEESELRAYEKQQEYIRQNEEFIRKYKAGIKSKQARGREAQLARLERLDLPEKDQNIGSWKLNPVTESGQDVLLLKGIVKSFGPKLILDKIDFNLRKGDKTAIIGPNGCGKSTLLKIILGIIKPDAGEVRLGSRVKTAYFSQEFEELNPDNTVLDEIIYNSDLNITSARSLLGRMLFKGDDVFKPVASLSGGEKSRLCLLKVILSGANFLILDEPTNHLDIASKQVVEELLAAYSGTVLIVSHDRYFLDQVVTGIAALDNKKLKFYPGNYSYYAEKIKENKVSLSALDNTKAKETSPAQQFRIEQKNRERQARQLQNSLQMIEQDIELWETRKKELEDILADPNTYSDNEKASTITSEYQSLTEKIASAYSRWEELLVEIEQNSKAQEL